MTSIVPPPPPLQQSSVPTDLIVVSAITNTKPTPTIVEDFYLLNPIEAFDYIMAVGDIDNTSHDSEIKKNTNPSTNTTRLVEYDKELLHKCLEEGKQRQREQQEQKKEQQEQQKYEAMMQERIFLNSFIPRTLNEITVTERDYCTTTTKQPSNTTTTRTTKSSIEAQAIAAMTIRTPMATSTTTVATTTAPMSSTAANRTTFQMNPITDDNISIDVVHTNTPNNTDPNNESAVVVPLPAGDVVVDSVPTMSENPHVDDDDQVDNDEDEDDDDSNSSSNGSDGPYERIHRTAEDLEQERMVRRELRRTNKKVVKEQQSMKRQNKKMKKKDKKRAITKTKTKA